MNWQRTKQNLLGGVLATALLLAAAMGTKLFHQRAAAYNLPDVALPHHMPLAMALEFHITPIDMVEPADDATAMFIMHYLSNDLMLRQPSD